ncbi:MAG: DnaJ domain-containing protein [Cyanobacteria bacterium P01_A01_bin.15]
MESLTYYYRVLNLEPGSTKEDIKRAYRKLAQQWHPDKFLKQPYQLKEAREKFELIKEAYDRLIGSSYTEAPEINPHISVRSASAQDHYEEGILYLQAYKYEQAIESFTQAIRKKSDYLQAYQARAFILEQLGLHLRAKLDFDKVADLKRHHRPAPSQQKPADAELYFQQGLVQFQARKYGAAIEMLSKAIAINPNHQEAYRYRSQAYFRRGYDQQADADFNRMRELEQQVKHSAPPPPPTPQPSAHYATWHCAYTLSRHTQTADCLTDLRCPH